MPIHFQDSAQHERGLRFEQWQQLTDEALSRPGVQEELGDLGGWLLLMNMDAFLPNVRHGEIIVPDEYKDTDQICIVPRLSPDDTLKPHRSLLQPTFDRIEKVRVALGGVIGLDDYIAQAVSHMEADVGSFNPTSPASGGAVNYYDEARGIVVTSRPFVIPNWSELPENPILKGLVGAHELVHVYDIENLQGEPDICYRALTELRARRVESVLGEAAVIEGDINVFEHEHEEAFTIEIENARQRFGIDPNALLSGEFQLNEDNLEIALYLLAINAFRY